MDAVLSWGAAALFVGPILAGIALVVLRWIMNKGYLMHTLVLGLVLYGAYYFTHSSPPPGPTPGATRKVPVPKK